jgi:voltage-gated potassium channel
VLYGISGLRKWKYLALLAALLVAAVLEPLVGDWGTRAQILASVMVVGVNLGVFLVIFEQRWERWLAFFLVAVVLASGIVHQTLSNFAQIAAIVYHCFAFVFLGFAVAVILKRIFHQETVRTDAVIGALCGYLLAAAAWANAYALIYLLRPGSFRIAGVIAAQLSDWNLHRFYFNYFSVTTLTSLGYGDITPIGTLALSLSWLEVVFGQFYIAVVVAQLVGLRLAESIKRERRDSN